VGLDGVWLATPAADFLMLFVVLGLFRREFSFLRGHNLIYK
jgi:Na+-driven multidrug efflux pump